MEDRNCPLLLDGVLEPLDDVFQNDGRHGLGDDGIAGTSHPIVAGLEEVVQALIGGDCGMRHQACDCVEVLLTGYLEIKGSVNGEHWALDALEVLGGVILEHAADHWVGFDVKVPFQISSASNNL